MADWRDDFRQGSFRGVEFFTQSHSFSSGRRNVDHEFPSKEEGNSEDIGLRLPRYSLDIYVLGDDYFDKRDELREALDKEGPGDLIHPYLGEVGQVQVSTYTISETKDEGRICRISVEFVEAGVPKFPAENLDFFASLLGAAESVVGFAKDVLAAGVEVAGFPARVATAAADVVSAAADQVDDVAKIVGKGADSVADVAFAIRNIKADISDLLRTPEELANRFQSAFDLLFEAADDFKDLANQLSGTTSSFSPTPVVDTGTPTSSRIQGNQLAIQNFIVELSLATQARAAIQGNYLSVQEAVFYRDQLSEDISNQLINTTSDDMYQSLRDVQVQAGFGLPPVELGELITYTPPKTLPALVISHILFGNVSREQEIIDENNVRHPGFVPGQIPIEVTSG